MDNLMDKRMNFFLDAFLVCRDGRGKNTYERKFYHGVTDKDNLSKTHQHAQMETHFSDDNKQCRIESVIFHYERNFAEDEKLREQKCWNNSYFRFMRK